MPHSERANSTRNDTSLPGSVRESALHPSPEQDGGLEPKPENESIAEPRPGKNSVLQLSPEKKITPESHEGESASEPSPEWKKAFKSWQEAWPSHTYFFAIIFLCMSFYSGYYIIVNVKDGLDKNYLSISLNFMMFILSVTRSFVLFLDPYHQGKIFKDKLVLQLMWSIGTPCLLASDSLCILALAESANVNLKHQRFQRLSNILIVIFLHFFLVITTEVIVSAHSNAKVMILFCQVFSIIWGAFLGLWYFSLAHKINKVLFKAVGRRKTRGDRVYFSLIYFSSAANLFTSALILYSAVGVFGVYSKVKWVKAWPWYVFQTGQRLSEVIAALLVFTVSAKRNRIKKNVNNVLQRNDENFENDFIDKSLSKIANEIPQTSRSRRMSMFSAVHQSKLTFNTETIDSLASSNVNSILSSRGQNLSSLSEIREKKMLSVSETRQKDPNDDDNTTVLNENKNTTGRRMSMFSQLQEIKLSANENFISNVEGASSSTPFINIPSINQLSTNSASIKAPCKTTKSSNTPTISMPKIPSTTEIENEKDKAPSQRQRRMSMFSQLQELKLSSSILTENSIHKNSSKESHENKKSVFPRVLQFLSNGGKKHKRRRRNKIFCACKSMEIITQEERDLTGIKMANSYDNSTIYISDKCDIPRDAQDNYKTRGRVANTMIQRDRLLNNEWKKGRRSLIAGLRDKVEIGRMKIVEDEREYMEEKYDGTMMTKAICDQKGKKNHCLVNMDEKKKRL